MRFEMTKAKKRLIIICSIIGTFIVLGVLFGVLFSVQRISVDFATNVNRFDTSAEFKSKVVKASQLEKGKSIIFTNFDKVEKRLEKAIPYGKFHIVRTFPNKVIIYVYERKPVFRIQDSNGDWQIYDESLKLLQIVANANLEDEFNNLPIPPAISGVDLNLCTKEGNRMREPDFKKKYSAILDGVYGAHESPINIMSHIVFSYDEIIDKQVITFTLANSGTKIVVQGTDYFEEKIAYGLHIYLSSIREDNYYSSILDEVVITVYDNFVPEVNSSIIISPEKS